MSDQKAAAPAPPAPAKPRRPHAEVRADLERARAEINRLRPLAEADGARERAQKAYVDRCRGRWALNRSGDEFDPMQYSPPAVLHRPDEELHKRYHRQHYVVAALEKELRAFDEADIAEITRHDP